MIFKKRERTKITRKKEEKIEKKEKNSSKYMKKIIKRNEIKRNNKIKKEIE